VAQFRVPKATDYLMRVVGHGPDGRHITAVDDGLCILETGADSPEMLAAWLGMLGADFSVSEPPELVEQLTGVADCPGAGGYCW
jgi:hypothetical protein